MNVTAFSLAQRFVGVEEVPGAVDNPHVMAMLRLDNAWPSNDEVPWCSAFANYVAWLLGLPRTRSLLARSWLTVGHPVQPDAAVIGFDVVVLQRGTLPQPGPENVTAPGHVGFFAGRAPDQVLVLGGNQGNKVSIAPYAEDRILGVRRLHF